MYSAPDFIVVRFDQSNTFASKVCTPGYNGTDYGTGVFSCDEYPIYGQTSVVQCYFLENPS